MKIGGLQKVTLIDYPGKVACTVFLSGCPFRCPWCYSGELVMPEKIKEHPEITKDYFFEFLEKRKGVVDAVVVCGGEPTINEDLPEFLSKIREKGFLIKIDTNGFNPEMIEKLIKNNLVDYIAMDIKSSLEKYKEATGVDVDIKKIKKSIAIIKESGIEYEFRTTLVPGFHQKEEVEKMAKAIEGANKYFLQNFLPEKTINGHFEEKKPFSSKDLEEFKESANLFVKMCEIR